MPPLPEYRSTVHSVFRLSLCGVVLLLGISACSMRGPVVGGSEIPAETGTISGTVRTAAATNPLPGRLVTAVNVASGAKFEATTGTNGGYTLMVPAGRYRMQVELRTGETVSEGPTEIDVNDSDVDADRDFLIGVRPPWAA